MLNMRQERQIGKKLAAWPLLLLVTQVFFLQPLQAKDDQLMITPEDVILRKSRTGDSGDELFVTFRNHYGKRIQGDHGGRVDLVMPDEDKPETYAGQLFTKTETGWRRGHPIYYDGMAALVIKIVSQKLKHCDPIRLRSSIPQSHVYKSYRQNKSSNLFATIRVKDSEYASPCEHLDKPNP